MPETSDRHGVATVAVETVADTDAATGSELLAIAERIEQAEALDVPAAELLGAAPPWIVRGPEDPVTAIDGGEDGLKLTRTCLAIAARHLLPGGPVVLQVAGPHQADPVTTLVARSHPNDLVAGDRLVVDDERAVLLLSKPPRRPPRACPVSLVCGSPSQIRRWHGRRTKA